MCILPITSCNLFNWKLMEEHNQAYCTLRNGNLRNEMKFILCEMKIYTCEMKICTLRNEVCTLRNENLYFVKWKSVLCKMKICTLQNENLYFAKCNLYFAKWKSVLCEMKICTLHLTNSGTFLKRFLWRSFWEPTIPLQSWLRHTFFCRGIGGRVLDSSTTATKGINLWRTQKCRSRNLGPQTRKT